MSIKSLEGAGWGGGSLLRRGFFVLWGGWGERKRERAGHDMKGKKRREVPAFSLFPSSPARFLIFPINYCYFYRDTQRKPMRRTEGRGEGGGVAPL